MQTPTLATVILTLSELLLFSCGDVKKPATPPPTVFIMSATRRTIALYTESVATLDGYVDADIRARVKGFLRTQAYKDGAAVRIGQPLFTIESTDYSAAVAGGVATLARARVAQAHTKMELERDRGLLRTGTLSKQDFDNEAAVQADADGQVQAAEAQLDQLRLNLSYTQIRSPLEGVAGIALVRVGNLVGQDGPTLLTTVSQIDPIRVNFPMAEADYLRHFASLDHMEERTLAWARQRFIEMAKATGEDEADGGVGDSEAVTLILADGTAYPQRGVVVSVNRQVDSSTGTIQVQALIPNPQGRLRPGGYGSVRIRRSDAGRDVLAVPDKALLSVQGASSLGIVEAGNKVSLRRVELGPSVNGMQIIEKGIKEGDRIVVEGVQKLKDGATVDPKPVPMTPAASASAGPRMHANN
jgi:membrane fusion protein (multidrug efflux system)